MLVLSRRVGERVVIENDIHVTVVAVEGRRVYLGIEAPEAVSILRSELTEERPVGRRPAKVIGPKIRKSARIALYR
jgi:carbon storage regulator CsrA